MFFGKPEIATFVVHLKREEDDNLAHTDSQPNGMLAAHRGSPWCGPSPASAWPWLKPVLNLYLVSGPG